MRVFGPAIGSAPAAALLAIALLEGLTLGRGSTAALSDRKIEALERVPEQLLPLKFRVEATSAFALQICRIVTAEPAGRDPIVS